MKSAQKYEIETCVIDLRSNKSLHNVKVDFFYSVEIHGQGFK